MPSMRRLRARALPARWGVTGSFHLRAEVEVYNDHAAQGSETVPTCEIKPLFRGALRDEVRPPGSGSLRLRLAPDALVPIAPKCVLRRRGARRTAFVSGPISGELARLATGVQLEYACPGQP